MAAKLTFEAQMNGLEKVLEYLNKANTQLSDLGKHGGDAFSIMEKKAKDFNSSMEYLARNKSGLNSITKMFDEFSNKAQSIVGKSQSKIIETYKADVEKFENVIQKIDNRISFVNRRLEELRSKKQSMSEEDYLREEKTLTQKKSRLEQEFVLGVRQKNEAERRAWEESPFFGEAGKWAREKGGMTGKLLGASNLAMQEQAPGYLLSAAGTIAGLTAFPGMLGRAITYSSLLPSYEFLTGQAVQQQTAQAASGDVTTAILRRAGVGIEANRAGSFSGLLEDISNVALNSREFRGLVGGLTGLGAGLMTGNPVLGLVGLAGGMTTGALNAEPITMEMAYNQRIMQLAELDKKLFDVSIGQAGKNFFEEAQLTKTQQRMFGVDASHENIADLMKQGVADLKDLAGFISELNKFGKTLKNAEAGVFGERFGMTGVAGRREFARSVAAYGETAAMNQARDLAARAGFYSKETMPGREVLSEYAAAMSERLGYGYGNISQTGAAVAGAASRMTGDLPVNIKAETAVSMAGAFNEQLGRSGGLTNTLMRAGLAKLGITNPIVQRAYIDLLQSNPTLAIEKIAAATGKRIDEVQTILGTATSAARMGMGAATGLKEGSKDYQQLSNIADPTTYLATANLRTSMDAKTAGLKFGDYMQSALTMAPEVGAREKVELGEGVEDLVSRRKALEKNEIESMVNEIAKTQGKTVSDVLTTAIADGFISMANQIRNASVQIGLPSQTLKDARQAAEAFGKNIADTAVQNAFNPQVPLVTSPPNKKSPEK